MNLMALYQQSYRELNKLTPLTTDCGKICGQACCRGDREIGMYLFPGEQELLGTAEFLTIQPAHWQLAEDQPVLLASCEGACDRNLRPLACRIFPLTPYLTLKDILIVKTDPRSFAFCPLTKYPGQVMLDLQFRQKVSQVCRRLIADPLVKKFVQQLSLIIDDYAKFYS